MDTNECGRVFSYEENDDSNLCNKGALCNENCFCSNIVEIIDCIKGKKDGQYYENIVDVGKEKFNWEPNIVDINLKVSEEHHVVKRINFRKRLSFRIVSYDKNEENYVYGKDDITSTSSQTTSQQSIYQQTDSQKISKLEEEFTELKSFIWHLGHLGEKTDSNIIQIDSLSPQENLFHSFQNELKTAQSRLINTLEKRIDSLQNQLLQKQNIIESLLKRPNDNNIIKVNQGENHPKENYNGNHNGEKAAVPRVMKKNDRNKLSHKVSKNNTTNRESKESTDQNNYNEEKENKKNRVILLGDSTVKHVQGKQVE